MKADKEKWVSDVFDSLKGMQRAQPEAGLLAKIEAQIEARDTKVVPIQRWRIAAAAAILLLTLNVFTMRQYVRNISLNTSEQIDNEIVNQALISNYKLYE